ncbi:alpha-1A adrenergic receptor-like [Littorina saxatilis]
MCAFFNIFGWGSSDMGVLLTVAMTTERSLAIQFPLKAPTLCTVKRAKIVSLCLFFLELLKVGHFIYGTRVSSIEVTAFLCDVDLTSDPTYAIFYTEYWPYIHNVFLLVAFIVIIIGNIIITVHVKRSEDSKDMGEGAKTAGGGKGGKMSSKSRQLSMMLIIDSATIVVCTLPFSLYVVVDQTFSLFEDTPEGRGQSSLIFAIVFYLLYVNRCANFFLYCVSGARFRTTLKNILTKNSLKERRKKAQNYISEATNTRNMTSASSGFTSDGEGGDKVSMNPMGPSTVSGKVANEESKGVSMNPNGRPASTTSLASGGAPGLGGTSKLERHYGYGKA